MNEDEAIQNLLFSRVTTIPLQYPISWPNRDFSPPSAQSPSGGKYLRVFFVPNQPQQLSLKTHVRLRGLLQVSLLLMNGQGSGIREAGTIIDHFPKDMVLKNSDVSVRITRRPYASAMFKEEPYWHVPVTIEWECLNVDRQ